MDIEKLCNKLHYIRRLNINQIIIEKDINKMIRL